MKICPPIDSSGLLPDVVMPIRLAPRESGKDHLEKLNAVHAVALGATVVFNNIKDFVRYPEVMTENWLIPAEPED